MGVAITGNHTRNPETPAYFSLYQLNAGSFWRSSNMCHSWIHLSLGPEMHGCGAIRALYRFRLVGVSFWATPNDMPRACYQKVFKHRVVGLSTYDES